MPSGELPDGDDSQSGGPDNEVRGYRRASIAETDAEGYRWVTPSASVWPNVKPDGKAGRPPGPRTRSVGYSLEERQLRIVFRDGATYSYDGVSPQEFERLRRTASTGKFLNRVLSQKSYRREQFDAPR